MVKVLSLNLIGLGCCCIHTHTTKKHCSQEEESKKRRRQKNHIHDVRPSYALHQSEKPLGTISFVACCPYIK